VTNFRSNIFASLFIALNLFLGVQQTVLAAAETSPGIRTAGTTTGTVISTLEASGYTYVEASVGDQTIWLAGPTTKLAKGDSITVNTSTPMQNFKSKTLKRDFPVIYFVTSFSANTDKNMTDPSPAATLPAGHQPINVSHANTAKKITLEKPVKRVAGGRTIAEIIASKKELSGKTIKVRGQVSKYTANVMKKNWLHIIDANNGSDLTVITDGQAEVGQIALIEGTLVLDKDFGYGYFYELLIEDAKVTIEK